MVYFICPVMTQRLFSLPLTKVGIHFGHVRICATPYPISWIIFILDLGPSYIVVWDCRWVNFVKQPQSYGTWLMLKIALCSFPLSNLSSFFTDFLQTLHMS